MKECYEHRKKETTQKKRIMVFLLFENQLSDTFLAGLTGLSPHDDETSAIASRGSDGPQLFPSIIPFQQQSTSNVTSFKFDLYR